VREFLAIKQITVLERPANSPELAPNDFFSFPEDKGNIEKKVFDGISINTKAALKVILQNQFQNCFDGWTRRWLRCIAYKGEYFESDQVVFSNQICSTFNAVSSRTLLSHNIYLCHTVYWNFKEGVYGTPLYRKFVYVWNVVFGILYSAVYHIK
jgi:hypothetical protein